MRRRSVWVRYVGGREAVPCESWSRESYSLQKRWRLWSLLQGSVLGQEYLFPESRHCHRHWRVPRLLQNQHSLWSQWCSLWSIGYHRRVWSPPQPWSHPRHLPEVHIYFISILFSVTNSWQCTIELNNIGIILYSFFVVNGKKVNRVLKTTIRFYCNWSLTFLTVDHLVLLTAQFLFC